MKKKSSFSTILIIVCLFACAVMIYNIVNDFILPIFDNTIADLPQGKVYTAEDMDEKFSELIDSDASRYAYGTLSDADKELYEKILYGICAFADRIDIEENGITIEELRNIYTCIRNDYPEIFWVYNKSEVYCSGNTVTDFIPYYLYSEDDSKLMAENLIKVRDNFVTSLDGQTDYDKIMYIFNYIVDYTEYDSDSYNLYSEGEDSDELELSCNIYGTLMKQKALCEGYSKTLQFLLNAVDIDCIYITGKAEGEGHAWNYVWLDNSYYAIDITWCDPQGDKPLKSYSYCLIDDTELKTNHVDDVPYELPACNGGKYEWFEYNNYELMAFDISVMTDMFYKAYTEGRDYVEIKCADENTYNQVLDCISTQTIFVCFNEIEAATGKNYEYISYELIDAQRCIIIEIDGKATGADL
jgi:hypothetical protein